ncbi:MAG: HAMP domain-containing protein [Candidatus Eisenbacteria bacterium]|nr:HAMP domain-containing protein [Candidatus Eisenbacteria bacterium]
MRGSFAQRLFGGFLLVLAAGLAVLGWQAHRFETRLFEARERAWAFRELSLAAAALPTSALQRHDSRELDAWCNRMGAAAGARITLVDSDGRLLGDSDVSLDSLTLVENHNDRPEVTQARAYGQGWARRHSHTLGLDLWYGAVPLPSERATKPVLRMAVPQARLANEEREQQRLLLFSLVVAFLTAAALALLSARVLGGRLRRALDAARRMGQGELDARAPEQPDDEVGRLGRSLNQMAARLEERLRELAEGRDQRERILAHMVDGVVLVGADGRVVHANRGFAAILGLAQPPAPGSRFLEEVRQPVLAGLLERARGHADALTEEITFFSPVQRTVEAAVVNLGGAGTGAQLLVMHDLSRVKLLERVRQEFVANVSHELKTPLTLIRGSAETLLDGGLEDEAHRRAFVEKIERHSERLQRIVEDLLELARLEQPGVRAGEESVDLAELARGVVQSFRDAAASRSLALEWHDPGGPVAVSGDVDMLERAIANLVDNAVKYTQQGSVSVRVGREAGVAFCEIRDTGPGIPAEHLSRIFERFYRVDQGRSRELGGTGLGLSIVRHVAELHGGSVRVESELGRGSVFRVEIPVAAALTS